MRILLFCALLASGALGGSVGVAQQTDASRDARLKRVVDDYIQLYARETLNEWRDLFLPTFVAGSIDDTGAVTTRTLEEFYERQRGFFATGRAIR